MEGSDDSGEFRESYVPLLTPKWPGRALEIPRVKIPSETEMVTKSRDTDLKKRYLDS